jgi:energy-converting hydrogenase Eha subunit H
LLQRVLFASGAAGAARDRFVAMASGPLWRTAALLLTRCGTQRTLQGLEDMCKGLQIVCPFPPTINNSWRHMHTTNRGMLGTTVLCVRKGANVVMIGDGQVTQGAEIIKPNVRKVRRLGANVIGGFAGLLATAPLPINIFGTVFLN